MTNVHSPDERHAPDAVKGIMRAWMQTYQPAPVPGVADSIGNHPGPRMPGQIASGHPVTMEPPGGDPFDPGRVDVHDWNQQVTPAPFADLATVSGSGPLASSIECHQGRARVVRLDQATAANPSMGPQLGERAPSGNPAMTQQPPHPAPSGAGEMFGSTPGRSHYGQGAYMTGPLGRVNPVTGANRD